MSKNVLLLGRTAFALEHVQKSLSMQDVTLFSGTTLEDVQKVFGERAIDIVIMGAGLGLEKRLEIVRHIFSVSDTTTVHMKDRDSGREGMIPFVKGILQGLRV